MTTDEPKDEVVPEETAEQLTKSGKGQLSPEVFVTGGTIPRGQITHLVDEIQHSNNQNIFLSLRPTEEPKAREQPPKESPNKKFSLGLFERKPGGEAYPWNNDELEKHIKGLEKGALIVSCADTDVLHAATFELATAGNFAGYGVFRVNLNDEGNIDLEALLNHAEHLIAEQSRKKCIFVVEATRILLAKLSPNTALRLHSLPGVGIHMLFMVPKLELEDYERPGWQCGIDHWAIDALPILLGVTEYRGKATEEELRTLASQCKPQSGRSRTARDETDMIAMVRGCLQDGGGIEGVKLALAEGRLGGRIAPADLKSAREQWANAGTIERASLFLAVSFPDLPWEAFEYLMPALLAGRTETVTTPIQSTSTDMEPLPRCEIKTPPALDVWRTSSHELLAKIGICSEEVSGAEDVVRFVHPERRYAMHEALSFHANISRDFFDSLHAHGIYFDPNTPLATVTALAAATRRLLSRASLTYNEQWLHLRVRDIQRWVGKKKVQEARSIEAGSLEQLYRSLIRAEESGRNLQSLFFNRLCDLCSVFLAEQKTAPVVDRFIQLLVQEKDADPTVRGAEILEIVRRLKGLDSFDHMKWIKHLLNAASNGIREGAMKILFLEQKEPHRFWAVCKTLSEWVPSEKEPISQQCQVWALAFLTLWFIDSTRRYQSSRSENEQSIAVELSLFAEADGMPKLAERLDLINGLLSHPAFTLSNLRVLRILQKLEDDGIDIGDANVVDHEDTDSRDLEQIDRLLAAMLARWHDRLGGSETIPALMVRLRSSLPDWRLVNLRRHLRDIANRHQSERGNVDAADRLLIDRLVGQARRLEELLYPPAILSKS